MKKEKAIELISKLLKTASDKGATENEAMTAALRAQELMAKYDVNIVDVEEDTTKDEITTSEFNTGTGNKWKYSLAMVIADNFCCKVYVKNTSIIVFYGYKKNSDVACEVFKFLYNVGNRLADRHYFERYNNGLNTKGVKNSFLVGYVMGIKSVLEKQCRALMIVTPEEVKEEYKKHVQNMNMKKKNASTRYNSNSKSYDDGYKRGRETAQSRYIED